MRNFLVVCIAVLLLTSPSWADDTWAFNPPVDTFDGSALFDLRSLNEKVAGESGFIHRSADGHFVLGSGAPVRFWAVGDTGGKLSLEDLDHHARWLAKRGVNMIRFHTELWPTAANSKITDVNEDEIDQCWRLVGAMKKAGIYTTISPYWAVPVKIQPSWNVPGNPPSAMALLFWDKQMQSGYKAWWKALLKRPNKYTGIALADDPAVAILQLQNEDSMLFWTMQGVKGEQANEIGKYFGDWAIQKYGSLDKALAAWDHAAAENPDDISRGVLGMYLVWNWTQPGAAGGRAKRLADQLQFFAETMRHFNSEMIDYLHKELGCKQLINCGNWRTADPVRLQDVERYAYTAGDVMATNRYFDGVHLGPHNGWAIEVGDHFTNASALLDPRALPVNYKQVVGFPSIVTESEWVAPTEYQSEGPFLVSAYSSLSGVDSFYWFSNGDNPEWQPPRAKPVGYWHPPLSKWQIGTPQQLGQFPAAALIFRKGYIKQAPAVVHEERTLDDLWARKIPIISEEGAFDPNRDKGEFAERSNVKTSVDPLAFLVGRVEVKYGGDDAKTTALDLGKYIDAAHKTVSSQTGQLKLDYGVGICTLNAPAAQGVCGFLAKAGGDFHTADVDIHCTSPYASILVVSMDEKPIRESKKILLQVGTMAHSTGWADKDADFVGADKKTRYSGKEVVAVGESPWQVASIDAQVTVKNTSIKSADLLDANGMVVEKVPATAGASLTITLPANAMYVVLH